MAFPDTIKNPRIEQQLFANRALFAASFIILLLITLVGRMIYLQIISHDHFTTLSQDNRVRVVAVPPPRGLILDRNGTLLAENLPHYSLDITPSQVGDLDQTLIRLALLVELDKPKLKRFHAEVARKQSFQSIPLRFNLSDEEVARFAVNRQRFPGVEINARLGRHYPLNENAVHAFGYVGRISEPELREVDPHNYSGTSHIGKLGIERYYEDILHGKVGYQHVEINAQGRVLRVLSQQPPVRGTDLLLTLDSNLQRVAEQALGEHNGAIVAMDPSTGEILALASMPTYDPNLFVNGISTLAYKNLRNNPDLPLFNRALTGQYPPGSTIKPMVALAGLNYGVITADKTIAAGPYYTLPNDNRRYRDWKRSGHGLVDMAKSITQSCDVYFYDLAHKLGINRMHDFFWHFGLGRRNGLDSTGESSGLVPSPEWKRGARGQPWFPGETIITGIGQGYMLTTPLQLATATSILAMRGKKVVPRLLKSTRSANSDRFEAHHARPPKEQIKLQQQEFWNQVIGPMVDVAHKTNGTAYRIGRDAKYKIAGKTGTAQVFGLKQNERYNAKKLAKELHDHALFIAFAPAEEPRIAVAVVVENGGSGSKTAAPVAREVMDYYLCGELNLCENMELKKDI
ncbi:MAG: penicillin-binding protein 2 [Gammaproteobacteria bacterium]|nr:penicillin-binding protein 2 [Gammaproteobacteria bacterium]